MFLKLLPRRAGINVGYVVQAVCDVVSLFSKWVLLCLGFCLCLGGFRLLQHSVEVGLKGSTVLLL